MWNFARTIQKKVILASYRYWGWKVDFFENPKRKKSWIDPGAPSTSTTRSNRFGRKTMLCVWWDQLIPNAINNNWSIWTICCLKNDQNTKRGNTRSFFSMTMLHHIRQYQFGTCWKHSVLPLFFLGKKSFHTCTPDPNSISYPPSKRKKLPRTTRESSCSSKRIDFNRQTRRVRLKSRTTLGKANR